MDGRMGRTTTAGVTDGLNGRQRWFLEALGVHPDLRAADLQRLRSRRTAIIDAAAQARGPAGAPGPAEMPAELDAIARRGYLVAESHNIVGVTDIAAPVLDRNGRALGSIVVPHLNRHGTAPRHEEVLRLLLDCAAAIGDALR